jgi:hypothetical protein
MSEQQASIAGQIQDALNDPDLPGIYFNGFITTIGNQGDVLIVLQRNGKPVAVLNASYTIAHTLSVKLAGAISTLQRSLGQDILTTDVIAQKVTAGGDNDSV